MEYLPHHLIPFTDSNYHQENTFFLKESSMLVAWGAYSAGRVARGERFAFSRLSGRTHVLMEGVLLAVDGLDLPCGGEPFGGYSYLGTLYVLAPSDLGPLSEELHRFWAPCPVPSRRPVAAKLTSALCVS